MIENEVTKNSQDKGANKVTIQKTVTISISKKQQGINKGRPRKTIKWHVIDASGKRISRLGFFTRAEAKGFAKRVVA